MLLCKYEKGNLSNKTNLKSISFFPLHFPCTLMRLHALAPCLIISVHSASVIIKYVYQVGTRSPATACSMDIRTTQGICISRIMFLTTNPLKNY